MLFSKFSLQLLIRTLLILGNAFLLAYVVQKPDMLASSVFTSLLLCLQVFGLKNYVNQTNRKLAQFLINIKNQGNFDKFTKQYKNDYIQSPELVFDHINSVLKENKIKQLEQEQLLQLMINDIDISYLLISESNEVILSNKAYEKLKNDIDITSSLSEMNIDEEKLISIPGLNTNREILIRKSQIVLQQQAISVYSFADIQKALGDKELESWSKMIRVLTHEMMNSLTPIMSLTKSLRRYFSNGSEAKKQRDLSDELIVDALKNVNIILDRSQNLQHFIKSYKELSRLKTPIPVELNLNKSIENISELFREELEKQNISLNFLISNVITVKIDKQHLEQVLTNIIKNAIEALEDCNEKTISISARLNEGRTYLSIQDSGKGIAPEILKNIFIPFYTTKEDGSGIGLALSKQLLNLNKAELFVNSILGKGTEVSIVI